MSFYTLSNGYIAEKTETCSVYQIYSMNHKFAIMTDIFLPHNFPRVIFDCDFLNWFVASEKSARRFNACEMLVDVSLS